MCDEDLINFKSPSGSSPRQSKFCEPLIRPVNSSSLNLGTNPFDEVEQASHCLNMDDPFDFNFLKKITDSVEPVDEISNDNVIIKQHHKSEGTFSAAMCSELLDESHRKIKEQTDIIPQNVMKLPSNICLEELTLDSNVDQSFLINRFLNDNIQCKDSHRRSFSCGGSIGMSKYTITAELQEVSRETTTSNNTFNTAFVESSYNNGSNPYRMSRIRSASNSLLSAVFAKSSRESESAKEHFFSMGSASTFNTNNSLNLGFVAETSKDSYKHPICSWSSPPSCGAISLSDHNMLTPLSSPVIADASVGEYPSVFYEEVDQDQRILKEANDVVSKINHLRRISACSEEDIMLQELDYQHTPSLESDNSIFENKSTGELPNCLGNKDTKSKSTVNADERSQFPSVEYDDFLQELKQISEETKSTKLADFVNKIMKTNSPVMSKKMFDKQESRGSSVSNEYPKARPRSYSASTGIAKIKRNPVYRPNGKGPGVHTLQVPVGGKLRDRSASCSINKRSSRIGPVKAFLPFVETKGQAIASSTPTYTRKGHNLKASSTPQQVLNVTELKQLTRQNSSVFGSTCSSIPYTRERSASVTNVAELRIKDRRHVPSKESPKVETGDRKLYTPLPKYTQKGHNPKASSTPRLVLQVNKLTPLTRHNSLGGSTSSSTPFMRERSASATRVSEVRIKGRWSVSSKESPKEETGEKKGTKLYKPLAKIFGKVRGSNKENSSSSQ